MNKIIGIGEYDISNSHGSLITYALSSCVAMTVYDPLTNSAGLVHIALPTPLTIEEGQRRPGYFATLGIPELIEKMHQKYGSKPKSLKIGIYGGALSIRKDDYFGIGQKNIEAVIKTISSLNLVISTAEIGEKVSRSITMDVLSGKILVSTQPITI